MKNIFIDKVYYAKRCGVERQGVSIVSISERNIPSDLFVNVNEECRVRFYYGCQEREDEICLGDVKVFIERTFQKVFLGFSCPLDNLRKHCKTVCEWLCNMATQQNMEEWQLHYTIAAMIIEDRFNQILTPAQ